MNPSDLAALKGRSSTVVPTFLTFSATSKAVPYPKPIRETCYSGGPIFLFRLQGLWKPVRDFGEQGQFSCQLWPQQLGG